MYQIVHSKKFEKSLKRLIRGGLKKSVQAEIMETINILASGKKLHAIYRDHPLHGRLAEYRECHVQGDLLLVYQIIDRELVLLMVNIGSHNDVF